MWKEIVDYKRLDKVNVGHNMAEAFDLHDIVKCMLVRMIRRRYRNKTACPIYTEHNPDNPQLNYPDIWAKLGKDIYVWEIQDNITEKWQKNIIKQYEEVNLIIVPLKEVFKKWGERIQKGSDFDILNSLRAVLGEYVY
jgi:hypothetical protein